MVESDRDLQKSGEMTEETGAVEADPTLDIVRQLITATEAEAEPAQAVEPAVEAPVQTSAQAPEPPAAQVDPPLTYAGPEAWDEDPEDDSWEDLTATGGVRPYGIVDLETGEIEELAGVDEGADDSDVVEPVAPRRRRRRPGRRLIRRFGRWLGNWLGRVMRAVGAWTAARLAAAAAAVVRFLRRPDAPRRLAIALLLVFMIAWPLKVLSLTLLVPLAALITWASVGSEGCVELIVGWHARIKARDPDKAERIRLRAAATSGAIGRVLDRLPERWTQGLYLPDFEPEDHVPEKLKVDPFEELAARVHMAKRAEGGDAA